MSDPTSPSRNSGRRPTAFGFGTAVTIFALAYIVPPSPEIGRIFPMLLGITLIPLAAIIMSIIRSTRKFGLGMLLGCGAIWLVMLAICGGALPLK
jgi:riboflavin transporter FmnP